MMTVHAHRHAMFFTRTARLGRVLGLGLGAATCAAASFSAVPPATADKKAPRGAAIVTGGSRGIGAATCKKLAADGYSVVVVYRSGADLAAKVVSDIENEGGKAVAMQADVGEEAQIVRLFADVDHWRGTMPLTALINNAGVLGPLKPLAELNEKMMLDVIKVNTVGPAMCIREAEKRMSPTLNTANGVGGAIVQISSGSAYIGNPLAYSASKGGLNSVTIGLVAQLARQQIRINTISPGMTVTDMVTDTLPTFDMTQIPLGRPGTPNEMADVVAWLCSDESSYVAGANVRVAGGRPPGTTLG